MSDKCFQGCQAMGNLWYWIGIYGKVYTVLGKQICRSPKVALLNFWPVAHLISSPPIKVFYLQQLNKLAKIWWSSITTVAQVKKYNNLVHDSGKTGSNVKGWNSEIWKYLISLRDIISPCKLCQIFIIL